MVKPREDGAYVHQHLNFISFGEVHGRKAKASNRTTGNPAVRNWACFDEIRARLRVLEADETLLIQSGSPRIDFRLRTRYLDKQAANLGEALREIVAHRARREAVSIGLLGDPAEILLELAWRAKAGGMRPDQVTDQPSAHDLVNGYLPLGWTVAE